MGEPEDPSQFVRLQADDLTIFVARPLLEKLELGASQMAFYLAGYGRFWLAL